MLGVKGESGLCGTGGGLDWEWWVGGWMDGVCVVGCTVCGITTKKGEFELATIVSILKDARFLFFHEAQERLWDIHCHRF